MHCAADPVHLSVPASFEDVRRLAELARRTAHGWGVAEAELVDLELALVEAANNIVEHGFGVGEQGDIQMAVRLDGDRLTIDLLDDGRPAVLPDGREAGDDQFSESGRGLMLMRALVDEVTLVREGARNRTRLAKRLAMTPPDRRGS